MDQYPKKYTFHVTGMHCSACALVITEEVGKIAGIQDVSLNKKSEQLILGSTRKEDGVELLSLLNEKVASFGYAFTLEQTKEAKTWYEFLYAIPLSVLLIAGFLLLQKTGILPGVSTANTSLGTAFFVGLIASVSSCLAVVGGVVLSVSATYAKGKQPMIPQVLFHLGRIVGFFILGGVLGVVGSAAQLSFLTMHILNILVACVMLGLGFNLIDIFPKKTVWAITLPERFYKIVKPTMHTQHIFAPLLMGLGTFFLPCGFTQAMQLSALSTGTFLQGGLTMLFFAMGTFPVLGLISFSSYTISHHPWKSLFFKTAGFIVILLALLSLHGSLVATGVIEPLFNFS